MENGLTLYGSFIKEIKELIYRRQYEAMKKVNAELIQLYWEIGEGIYRKQREQGWGKSVVEILAKELQKEFPGVKGFTARNLWFMRQFFVEYSGGSNLKPMVSEIDESPNPSNLKPLISEFTTSNLAPSVREIERFSNTAILPPLVAELEEVPQKADLPPLVGEMEAA